MAEIWLATGAVAVANGSPSQPQCAREARSSSPPCGVVAVVGDQPITVTEFDHWLGIAAKSGGQPEGAIPKPPDFAACVANKRKTLPQPAKGRPKTTDRQLKTQCAAEYKALRDQVLQLLISFRWIRGEAEMRGITVTPSEVRAQFLEQKRASFPKQKDYEKFLKQSGQTEADILMRVELDALSNKIRARVTSRLPPVSDRDVERYYRRYRDRFRLPERRNLLVVFSKTKSRAAAARARIEAGERWAAVAKDLSIDEASRSEGGKLRWVAEGQLEGAFDHALFSARRGELRGPVRTRFGWYVFKVTKITPARSQSLGEARGTIAQLLRRRASSGRSTGSFRPSRSDGPPRRSVAGGTGSATAPTAPSGVQERWPVQRCRSELVAALMQRNATQREAVP